MTKETLIEKPKTKKGKKEKKKEKPKKISKFSNELTPDEIYSLQNSFSKKEGKDKLFYRKRN